MARVTFKGKPDFTGQVGTTVFAKGEGHTDSEGMLAYFRKHADEFEVEGDEPAEDEGPKLTPKQALQAELEERGLSTEGKVDELKARLAEFEAAKEDPTKGSTAGDSNTEAPAEGADSEGDDEDEDGDGGSTETA